MKNLEPTPCEALKSGPRIGHVARLGLDPRARWLVSAHLIVFALSLEDEEVVAWMAEAWDLSARAAVVAEAGLSLVLLAAWGALTLGWLRFAEDRRGERT